MELFTRVDTPSADFNIDYTSRIAFFGSCFADNISAQFAARKFRVLANPFGTVYNPVSIARQIRALADGKVFGEGDVFQDARPGQCASGKQDACGPWHCWGAHGSLSAPSREECIAKLNVAANSAREFLQQADTVFVTLGTSFVYYLKETGEAVANCHRQAPALFERRMITVEEATQALESIVQDLVKIKQDSILRSAQNDAHNLHIVFTVSPLRHMADGAHNNSLSKATLLLAINSIKQKAMDSIGSTSLQNDIAEYFPSYEIVMDELRDYRFYDSDMVHLSETAEEYIFERMADCYCDEKARVDMARVEKFMKEANHRVADMNSPATAAFAQKVISQAGDLEKSILGLDLRLEIAKFREILNIR